MLERLLWPEELEATAPEAALEDSQVERSLARMRGSPFPDRFPVESVCIGSQNIRERQADREHLARWHSKLVKAL